MNCNITDHVEHFCRLFFKFLTTAWLSAFISILSATLCQLVRLHAVVAVATYFKFSRFLPDFLHFAKQVM